MSLTHSQGQCLSLEVVFKKYIVINSTILVSGLIGPINPCNLQVGGSGGEY